MISNSDMLFKRMKEYQNKRKGIMDEYEQRLEWLEDKKGSKYYDEEKKIAINKRDESISQLQGEYAESLKVALAAMREANSKRKMKAPTEDELRVVQALKLRESISETELGMVANAVRGNALCIDIVREVARKNGILAIYQCDEKHLSPSFVSDKLDFLEDNCRDFLRYDTSSAARIGADFALHRHGVVKDERELAKRPLFDTKEAFFSQNVWLSGDDLSRFIDAVDSE